MKLWLLTEKQETLRLIDPLFQPCFYVHAQPAVLQNLALLLGSRFSAECRLVERIDIWQNRPLLVLEVGVRNPFCFRSVVHFVSRATPQSRLYNSDLILAALYCWQKGVFPLARIEVETDESGCILDLACEDSPWELDYELPPLRTMQLRLSGLSCVDPAHGRRAALEVEVDGQTHVLDDADVPAAANLARLLKRYDPDLLLTEWGDSTILPLLVRQAERHHISLGLNRDALPVHRSHARSYTSYGRILFKDAVTSLFGRLHVDAMNSFMADKCQLSGLWELVRVTKLPVQYASRTTPGTGISYMQMELAWHDGVLIPAQKAEPEDLKSPDELLAADRGGLVFTPRSGFFENVAELDFVSEYPAIMARFNISPETVNCPCCSDAPRVPELGYRICRRRRGITSRVVERLIMRRTELKHRLTSTVAKAAMAEQYRLRCDALKWLLVTCFGYTGYRNARFGKIEAHEAINAVARETLLVAKEIAEVGGFEVLHALVDSLYVHRSGARREEYERLAREIEHRTGLPMALEALYHYFVFLPSKQHSFVPVPNRFFGVREDGSLKVRGLECRRHDTPPIVAQMQREVLAILAKAHDFETYCRKLREAREVYELYQVRLEEGSVSEEQLVVSKRVSRSAGEYQKNSLTAIAARQLHRAKVPLRPGQTIQYIVTDADSGLPDDRVRAWGLWDSWRGYDLSEYQKALEKAFQPFAYFAD